MERLLKFLHPLLYRPHLENGLAVALGVGLTGLAFGWWLGLPAGIAAATGALCTSIADQPDPLDDKPRLLFAAVLLAAVTTLLTHLAKLSVWSLFVITATVGLGAGVISAFGKRAVGLGIVSILAFALTLGTTTNGRAAILLHVTLLTAGAVSYAVYALAAAWLFDRRVRRLLFAEALRQFARYLRAKAGLLDPGRDMPAALAETIEAHAGAVDRMQTARDAIYARTAKPWQQRQARSLIAMLDAFEAILSSDADIEILTRSAHRHLLRRLQALTLALAQDVERLGLAPAAVVAIEPHRAARAAVAHEIARIAPAAVTVERQQELAAFRSTAEKLAHSADRIAAIGAAEQEAPHTDLALFRQAALPRSWPLRAQIGFGIPAFRYAVRLAAALTTGLAITLAFPEFAHASWIVLTIALIMRASYSVTRQRRMDRVLGTIAGCILVAGIQNEVPAPWLLALVALAGGVAHAFGAVNYRVTAAAASVSALLLLHFLQPNAHHIMGERIVDTLIGAALSYVFGFLLPTWERSELPRTVAGLLAADRAFAAEALKPAREEQPYRLARKRLFDAVAALSGAVRRLADEPQARKELLAQLAQLLSANYLLLSDLISMQVLFLLRKSELDAVPNAHALTDEMRGRVLEILDASAAPRPAKPPLSPARLQELFQRHALSLLKRRLVHLERRARQVATLACAVVDPPPPRA